MRFFIYAGRLYEKYIAGSDYYQYSSELQEVPRPACVCFYNGRQEQPEEQVLKLSDAYGGGGGDAEHKPREEPGADGSGQNASGQNGAGNAAPAYYYPASQNNAAASRPAAPKLVWADATYLVVETVSGQLYSIDDGMTWQTGGIFTGLVPGQSYKVVTKAGAANGRSGSAISEALDVVLKSAGTTAGTGAGQSDGTGAAQAGGKTGADSSAGSGKVTKAEAKAAKAAMEKKLKASRSKDGSSVTVKWGSASGVTRFVVYAGYAGGKCKKVKVVQVSGKKGAYKMTLKKLGGKSIDKSKKVKIYVVAYRLVNGKQTKVAKTRTVTAAGVK